MVDEVLAQARRVLRGVAYGDGHPPLTMEQARALNAAEHDARLELARERARNEALEARIIALHCECDKLVGQVVSEEQRAADLERRLGEVVSD